MSVLDNPVWWAVTGPQRTLAKTTPLAGLYHPEVSAFGALAAEPTRAHWKDLAGLMVLNGTVAVTGDVGRPPSGWNIIREIAAVQMVGDQLSGSSRGSDSLMSNPSRDAPVPLGADDVEDMLALVAETRPGPFLHRTVEFGGYLGIRRAGRLIAMAGERVRPPGFTEISAVATHPDHRNQGLAELLIRTVTERIVGRHEVPFLHASVDNANAIRLYESIGFTRRRALSFLLLRSPDSADL